MDNKNIQNNNNNINIQNINQDENNGNTISNEINNECNIIKEEKENEKNKKIKYRLNFSVLIGNFRQLSDIKDKWLEIEFKSNILLMSSEINQSNKISCLTLISFINFEKKNTLYIYYLNKKIFKYLQSQKGIESFIYIRTLYRASFLLENEKNYFYAYKYIDEANSLSKNSKIDYDSKKVLSDLNNKIIKGKKYYIDISIKKFRDIEEPNNLNEEKYNRLKKLIKELTENKYQSKDDAESNKDNDEKYLYLINKKWVDKANNFLNDYMNVRDNNIKGNYFKEAFDLDYFYYSYFNMKEKIKNKYKYSPYPGLIDNYSISDWTDYWNDPLNEDENQYIQSGLIFNKDYYLLKENDFEFLKDFFGVTNIIKRKRNYLDFVIIKSIIFDKKLKEEGNIYLLRRRNLQIRKNSTILDFKKKILRCIENSVKNTEKKGDSEGNEDTNNNKYNIYFYLLEKDKKNILIEMCISYVNKIPLYDSLYIKNLQFSDSDDITKLLSSFNKEKHILIIETQYNDDPLFLKEIKNDNNNKYYCNECKEEILSLEDAYKCNKCHLSLFCSENCANQNNYHVSLDIIFGEDYLVEEFDLKRFLKKNLNHFFKNEQLKGMVGLSNLGNTCYMNSALQCLSNTFDLTKYFLLQIYKNDINRGNRLGSNGSIANKYYELIASLWCGKESKIAPIEFRQTIQKVKKQFGGYRQEDSQEFLSVLLDQLHEDLNRITNKPYVELLEKQPDEDDITASKRWWDLHKKREDSIIIDLFNGQLKSETICQVCNKSSITYDPFMFLCLPLPKPKNFLLFKIFCGIECILLIFEYFNKCTILDLKNKAFEKVKEHRKSQSNYFELEVVHLNKNKDIIGIISVDIHNKNYKGQLDLRSLLANDNEIIFYEKNIHNDEKDYFNIFIYAIKRQQPVNTGYGRLTNLEYITYPLFFQIKKNATLSELNNKVKDRLIGIHMYDSEKFELYKKKKQINSEIELNFIHGKETKKEGWWSTLLAFDDTCKYCQTSFNDFFYCPIINSFKINSSMSDIFIKYNGSPIKLAVTSDFFNLSVENMNFIEPNFVISNGSSLVGSYSENLLLKDCLNLFGEEVYLQDDDMWYCSKCKKHQISKQKLQIYKSPNYLIIQIKRFNIKKNDISRSTFNGEKNNAYVKYPIEDFDLSEYIVGPEKDNAKYDLYGVVQHFGSLNGGHYTAICKNDKNWVSYNDSKLDIVENPVTQNAYILFYVKKDLEKNRDK